MTAWVCLRNNNDKGLLNGGLWQATDEATISREIVNFTAKSLDDDSIKTPLDLSVPIEFFHGKEKDLNYHMRREYDEFDYGYALTVHKSQGSQWDNVVLFDESHIFRDMRLRWLYTGITRAAERLTIVL